MLTSTKSYDRATRTRSYVSAAGRTHSDIFDLQERLVQSSIPGAADITYHYDGEGRIDQIKQSARQTVMTYGADGLVATTTTTGPGVSRLITYDTRDALGRPQLVYLPGATPTSRPVGYIYDFAGNLTSVTPPGKPAHTQVFNSRDLMSSFTEPNATPATTTTDYNADLQPFTITFPTLPVVTIGYTLGLFANITVDSTVNRVVTRDAAERVSQLTTGTLDNVTLGFGYDGRFTTSVNWTGNVVGSLGYRYDNHFAVDRLTIAGTDYDFFHDYDDLLTSVSGPSASLSIGRNAANGRVETVTTGNVVETRTYDATYGELSSLSYAYLGSNRYSVVYTRDGFGRILTKTETIDALPPVTLTYTYDAADFLASETRSGSPPVTTTWLYDGNGNRTHLNGSNTGITIDAEDRMTKYSNLAYTYDYATGNTLSRATNSSSLTWDRLGNLRTITQTLPAPSVTYIYDGQGRRVARKAGPGGYGFKWLYDGQLRIVAELNSSNTVTKRFVYASRENVPDLMITATGTFRLVTDQLGSVRRVVNVSTGAVAQTIEYDAWGKVLSESPPAYQPFGFAGGLYDSGTGLVHFGARDYDANIGRWLSKDPARWAGGLNFYAYADNDPVNWVDPRGRSPEWGGEGSSGGAGWGGGGASGAYGDPSPPPPGDPCGPQPENNPLVECKTNNGSGICSGDFKNGFKKRCDYSCDDGSSCTTYVRCDPNTNPTPACPSSCHK